MKAILIDPMNKTIEEINTAGKKINEIIGCKYFDGVRLGNDFMYVDDEGLLKENHLFNFLNYGHPFAGKALIVGNDEYGAEKDYESDIEFIRFLTQFNDDGPKVFIRR